jgi:protein TonB
VTGNVERLGALLDRRGVRAALCGVGALAIWCGFAAGFVHGLWREEAPPPAREPASFDVRLVRLAPPPPSRPAPTARGAAPPAGSAAPMAPAAKPESRPAPHLHAATTQPQSAQHLSQRSVRANPPAAPVAHAPPPEAPHRDSTAVTAPATAAEPPQPPQPTAQPTAPAAHAQDAHTEGAPDASTAQSTNTAHPAAPATSGTSGSSAASGNGPAHAILQPLPSLPDDLRADAFQAVATARFSIHRDGSVDVELIKPTHNPRLNQLLLDALQKWRFFPAMKNGSAVESSQDIRVHFNVE